MEQLSSQFPDSDLCFCIKDDRIDVYCSCGAFLTYRLYNGSTVKETADFISLYFPGVYHKCPICKSDFGLIVFE